MKYAVVWKIQEARQDKRYLKTLKEAERFKLKLSRLGYKYDVEPYIQEL